MKTDTPSLGIAGMRRFEELRWDAISAVSERFCKNHTAEYTVFGERGLEACRHDISLHLDFLRPVLEFGFIQPMVDYLRWHASVLATRDIPADHLALSLDWLAQFFALNMQPADGQIVEIALHRTKAQFLTAGHAPVESDAMRLTPWAETAEFEASLLKGDRRNADALLDRCLEDGRGLVGAENHMIKPALVGIGHKWQNNQVSVAQEHLATAISQSVMTRGLTKSKLPASNGRTALLACVEGNTHSVGLQMVADALLLAGWGVQFLGANVPTESLIKHVAQTKPDLLGLSVSFAQQLLPVKDIIIQLPPAPSAGRPQVMVGGLAINQFNRLAEQIGADAWTPNAITAVAAADKLVASRSVA
jgi:MerR family transcriptional regulator, light-induced transcriptional regulator